MTRHFLTIRTYLTHLISHLTRFKQPTTPSLKQHFPDRVFCHVLCLSSLVLLSACSPSDPFAEGSLTTFNAASANTSASAVNEAPGTATAETPIFVAESDAAAIQPNSLESSPALPTNPAELPTGSSSEIPAISPAPTPDPAPVPAPTPEPAPEPEPELPAAIEAPAFDDSATITWREPSARSNGEKLPEDEIEKFRIYHVSTGNQEAVYEVDGTQNAITVTELENGTHTFSVTAVDIDNLESTFSQAVSKTILN